MINFSIFLQPYLDYIPMATQLIGPSLAALLVWWLRREWKLLGTPANKSIETRVRWLEDKSIPDTYQRSLQRLLKLINQWFGDALPAKRSLIKQLFGIQPWTAISFARLQLLAVFYPFLFLLLGWLLGNYGHIGGLEVLAQSPVRIRVLFCFSVFLEAFALYKIIKASGYRFFIWLIVMVLAIAIAVAVAGTFAVAVTVAIAGAIAGAFAFAGAGAVAGAVAVAGAGAGSFAVAVAGAVAGAVAFAVAFAFAVAQLRNYAAEKNQLILFMTLLWLVLLLYLCGVVVAIVHWGDPKGINNALTLLLFLGFLPLFNAPLDWLSFGFTRGLLYSIRSMGASTFGGLKVLLVGVIDVVAAIVFLVLVAVSTLAAITLLNSVVQFFGIDPVINLSSLWAQIREGMWQKNLWIWLMLGSTLIPTFIHFVLAVFALLVVLPHKPAKRAAVELKRARAEFLGGEVKAQGNYSTGNEKAVVGEDERRVAFLFTVARQLIILAFIVFLCWLLVLFFSMLGSWSEYVITLFTKWML